MLEDKIHSPVAQWLEQSPLKGIVAGSNPAGRASTMSYYYYVTEDNIKYHVESDGVNSIWFYTKYSIDGKLSRLRGPAVQYGNGKDNDVSKSEWWINGTQIECSSQEEFEQLLKMKAFW